MSREGYSRRSECEIGHKHHVFNSGWLPHMCVRRVCHGRTWNRAQQLEETMNFGQNFAFSDPGKHYQQKGGSMGYARVHLEEDNGVFVEVWEQVGGHKALWRVVRFGESPGLRRALKMAHLKGEAPAVLCKNKKAQARWYCVCAQCKPVIIE